MLSTPWYLYRQAAHLPTCMSRYLLHPMFCHDVIRFGFCIWQYIAFHNARIYSHARVHNAGRFGHLSCHEANMSGTRPSKPARAFA